MTKKMKCATEFAKWVAKHEAQTDLHIYVEGNRYTVDKDGNLVFDIKADPKDYIEYAGNFMTVSTEGPLYDILNYYNDFAGNYDERMNDELDKLFEKYGMYKEMGYSWSFSLYEC